MSRHFRSRGVSQLHAIVARVLGSSGVTTWPHMSQKPRGPLQHRPELIAQSVAYVDCPYCDGENVLRKIEPSCSESNGREECETACKHCQSARLHVSIVRAAHRAFGRGH